MNQLRIYPIVISVLFFFSACSEPDETFNRSMEVKASAYNSVSWQTQGDANITAWGDTLKPGMKVLAISRDLIDSGITLNTRVYIPQLEDTFVVKDKMNRRYTRKIDIYMGTNVDSARQWGLQEVTIQWNDEED